MFQMKPKKTFVIGENISEALMNNYIFWKKKLEKEMKKLTLAEIIHKITHLEKEKRSENTHIHPNFFVIKI